MRQETVVQMASLVRRRVSELLDVPPEELLEDVAFPQLGVDEAIGAEIIARLKLDLGLIFEPSDQTLCEHGTIRELAIYLAERQSACADVALLSPLDVDARPRGRRGAWDEAELDTDDEPIETVLNIVKRHVARICNLTPGELDDHFTFNELGMTASMRVTLIQLLKSDRSVSRSLSSIDTYQYTSLFAFARRIEQCGLSDDADESEQWAPAARSEEFDVAATNRDACATSHGSASELTFSRTVARRGTPLLENDLRALAEAAVRKALPTIAYRLHEFCYFSRVADSSDGASINATAHVRPSDAGEWLVAIVEDDGGEQFAPAPLLLADARVTEFVA